MSFIEDENYSFCGFIPLEELKKPEDDRYMIVLGAKAQLTLPQEDGYLACTRIK